MASLSSSLGRTIVLLREASEERNAAVEDIIRIVIKGGYMVAACQLDVGLVRRIAHALISGTEEGSPT